MPGIGQIKNNRRNAGGGGNRREQFWIEDSQVFFTAVGKADDDDPYMDSFWIYTFQENGGWTKVLSDSDGPLRPIPNGVKPSYRFGFWSYIHYVVHTEKKNDDWEKITTPAGDARYRETVNDFRFCILPFGKDDTYHNDFVDIYNDWGGDLSKGVIRVTRRGTGRNTDYSIGAQGGLDLPIPDEALEKVDGLPSAWDYMMDNYGVGQSSGGDEVPEGAVSMGGDTSAEASDDGEKLPWED